MEYQQGKLIGWKELSSRFKQMRGIGVGYHTIQSWQVSGMPYIRDGRYIWYEWEDCKNWYFHKFTVRRVA